MIKVRLPSFPLPEDARTLVFACVAPCLIMGDWPADLHAKLATGIGGCLSVALLLVVLVRRGAIEQRLYEMGGCWSIDQALTAIAKRLEATAHRIDRRNPVTGLPTREQLFHAMAEGMVRPDTPQLLGIVRFADFARLSAFDPDTADSCLSILADRLSGAIARRHLIAQVERDCFAIWLRGDGEIDKATAEIQALIYVAGQELQVRSGAIVPALEAGIAVYPVDGDAPEQLLNRALAGLSRVPASRDLQVETRPRAITESARREFQIEQGLARAIGEDRLDVLYQPVIDLAAGRLVGAEALLRWHDPELGNISPAKFMPLVESAGLSSRFGQWVLNAACRQARQWQDAGFVDLKVAVNLSASQLLDPSLIRVISRTLDLHGLEPQTLELELTETVAMVDCDRTSAAFTELSSLGVGLAIDDFGTGYSSLSYLKRLPFNKLKIDREFVAGIECRRDSQAICKSLIELGRGLDLKILAEGTETAAEVATLRDLGCEIFQGYFFARPLSATAFANFAGDAQWLTAARSSLKNSGPQVRAILAQ